MRSIKFRAWDKRDKFMYVPEGITNPFEGVERFIYMQFTGLLDKNGKEIYEGDVLKVEAGNEFGSVTSVVFAVMWCGHEGNWSMTKTPEDPEKEHFMLGHQVEKSAQVIGNIYENPELLKP